MEIESIPFIAFQALTSCPHALNDPENNGCQWFATTDRRVAGRIYLDPQSEAFRFTILKIARSRWELDEQRQTFERFEDAEAALLTAMLRESNGKVITVQDAPPKMRLGKGKARDATLAVGGDD